MKRNLKKSVVICLERFLLLIVIDIPFIYSKAHNSIGLAATFGKASAVAYIVSMKIFYICIVFFPAKMNLLGVIVNLLSMMP